MKNKKPSGVRPELIVRSKADAIKINILAFINLGFLMCMPLWAYHTTRLLGWYREVIEVCKKGELYDAYLMIHGSLPNFDKLCASQGFQFSDSGDLLNLVVYSSPLLILVGNALFWRGIRIKSVNTLSAYTFLTITVVTMFVGLAAYKILGGLL